MFSLQKFTLVAPEGGLPLKYVGSATAPKNHPKENIYMLERVKNVSGKYQTCGCSASEG